jgi:hypothetical protein
VVALRGLWLLTRTLCCAAVLCVSDETGCWEGGRCAGQAAALLWQLAYQDSEAQGRLRSLQIIPDLAVLLRLRGAEWIGERAEAAGVLMNLAEDDEGKQMVRRPPHCLINDLPRCTRRAENCK